MNVFFFLKLNFPPLILDFSFQQVHHPSLHPFLLQPSDSYSIQPKFCKQGSVSPVPHLTYTPDLLHNLTPILPTLRQRSLNTTLRHKFHFCLWSYFAFLWHVRHLPTPYFLKFVFSWLWEYMVVVFMHILRTYISLTYHWSVHVSVNVHSPTSTSCLSNTHI